jgi:DivIVA domain-containing protein
VLRQAAGDHGDDNTREQPAFSESPKLDRRCRSPLSTAERSAMPASGEGETRSVYVVQRHFRLVRRGYDPAEVDRHLQVVSEWFRHSRAAEDVTEREKRLHAREDAITEREQHAQRLLERQRLEAQATLDGARLRADAELKAGEQAQNEAQALLAHARHDAEQVRAEAHAERSSILDQRSLSSPVRRFAFEFSERRRPPSVC